MTGEEVGLLSDVINLPGQDLLAVDGVNGEILIPFVTEIVPAVDVTNKIITIDPPAGLFNLFTEGKESASDGE